MSRRVKPIVVSFPAPEEDTRPFGTLRFADPSKADFPRRINTFNEPHSPHAYGEMTGVRSVTGNLVPWDDRHSHDTWAIMNRKRGIADDSQE